MNEHAIMVILISQPIVQWRAQERICRGEEAINQLSFISEKKVFARRQTIFCHSDSFAKTSPVPSKIRVCEFKKMVDNNGILSVWGDGGSALEGGKLLQEEVCHAMQC